MQPIQAMSPDFRIMIKSNNFDGDYKNPVVTFYAKDLVWKWIAVPLGLMGVEGNRYHSASHNFQRVHFRQTVGYDDI